MTSRHPQISIEHDQRSRVLERLAALDEAAPIAAPALIATVAGRPVAALSLVDDRLVADPFEYAVPSRAVLRERARAIRAATAPPAVRRRGLRRVLAPRYLTSA